MSKIKISIKFGVYRDDAGLPTAMTFARGNKSPKFISPQTKKSHGEASTS